MSTPRQRVSLEEAELSERIAKLSAFVRSELFDTLSSGAKHRLSYQLSIMRNYRDVLLDRLAVDFEPGVDTAQPG